MGGFKKCFDEQDQAPAIAATGIVKMSAISKATSHLYSFSVSLAVATLDAEKR